MVTNDMIFTGDKKFNFSTHGCAILLGHTTTPILLNQSLKFFKSNPTLSPFPLVIATSLHFAIISSTMNLNLFATNHACENA